MFGSDYLVTASGSCFRGNYSKSFYFRLVNVRVRRRRKTTVGKNYAKGVEVPGMHLRGRGLEEEELVDGLGEIDQE